MEAKNKNASSVALKLLSLREHTCAELTRKLLQRGFSSMEIETVCDNFKERGYLNDNRVAEIFLAKALREKKKGPRRLRDELMRRGLEPKLGSCTVNTYLNEIDEQSLALEFVINLLAQGKAPDYIKLSRLC